MDGLRLILLLAGALVIVGVYLYSRRSGDGRQDAPVTPRTARKKEPQLGAHDADDEFLDDMPSVRAIETDEPLADGDESAEAFVDDDEPATPAPKRPETIIVLNILPATPGDSFPGADLLDVFDRAGLEYGQFDVFHRINETADGPQSAFSVASATEPGSFDITTMADERFRGLTLFMVLPGPVRGVDGFADMLATARRIAEQIRGEVKDRNRSTLTRQTAHHIREEIIAFEHRLKIES